MKTHNVWRIVFLISALWAAFLAYAVWRFLIVAFQFFGSLLHAV